LQRLFHKFNAPDDKQFHPVAEIKAGTFCIGQALFLHIGADTAHDLK